MSATDHEQPAPAPQPAPPSPNSPNRRAALVRAGLVLVVVLVVAAAVVGYQQSRSSDDAAAASGIAEALAPIAVTYQVETSDPAGGMVDITYKTASGIAQQEGVDVPLARADGTPGIEVAMTAGSFVSISAQLSTDNGEDGPTDVTCRITVGGRVVAENTSSGQFAIASCDGTA